MTRTVTVTDVRAALAVESEWDLPKVGAVRDAYHVARKTEDERGFTLADWDGFGYDIAYYVSERDQLTGDVLCGGCAAAFLAGDDHATVYPAYQINGEVGDAESVYCDDCNGLIYAGEELDYDKANAAAPIEAPSVSHSDADLLSRPESLPAELFGVCPECGYSAAATWTVDHCPSCGHEPAVPTGAEQDAAFNRMRALRRHPDRGAYLNAIKDFGRICRERCDAVLARSAGQTLAAVALTNVAAFLLVLAVLALVIRANLPDGVLSLV